MSGAQPEVAFLFDVDDTLLDNDRFVSDLQRRLESAVCAQRAEYYWRLYEQLRTELGYADYLGALQRYHNRYPHDPGILAVSRFLLNYPFAERLFPAALEVITYVRQWGPVALLTDGDVVFQPHKVERSGLLAAVDGRVIICLHKEQELDAVVAACPAAHYVLIEDKLRILTVVKAHWGSRVTTVFVRQGHYALDPKNQENYPPADITLDSIGDLLQYELAHPLDPEFLKMRPQ